MAPSAKELIERLREIYSEREGVKRLSNEKLAAHLPISLSTVNRWVKEDPDGYEEIVGMLEEAGWLRAGAATDRSAQEIDPHLAAKAIREVSAVLRRLLGPEAQQEQQQAPTRRRNRR